MVCTKCGKPLRQGADSCPSCGQNTDALAGTRAARTGPRPGGKPRISDEGIIHGTDGKYRWVHETDLWREPGVIAGSVVKFALIGAVVGLLGAAVMGPGAVLTAAVVGALAGLGVHAANAAANGGKRCEMYTLDESCLLCQQVDGRVSKQKVIQVIGDWVGGQSYPELTFRNPVQTRLACVTAIRPEPDKNRIRLSGSGKLKSVRMEPAQMAFVLARLEESCPAARK